MVTFSTLYPEIAQAAPTRKDWCGTIWSIENTTGTLGWINPNTGGTTTGTGPTTQIPTIPAGISGASVAALGIHKRSGTMYMFDRNNGGRLYKFHPGGSSGWQLVTISGLVGISGLQTIPGASNNLNKMTIDDNVLIITDSVGIAVYSISLDDNGDPLSNSNATAQTYAFTGDPSGTPAHRALVSGEAVGTTVIAGGDITTDEYGDVYNITYNGIVTNSTTGATKTTKAFFYKQEPSNKTWIYQGETTGSSQFAGAAFYRGDLYVKAGGQLLKVDLTRSGSGYTGWNNPLVTVGGPSSTSSGDLTACGTPSLSITKTRAIYNDAALTILAPDQSKVKPGKYIKYTIAAQNTGDEWSRISTFVDPLPVGTSYVPNSATLNGSSLGLATYPSAGFTVNSAGAPSGIVQYSPAPDTAVLSFGVQVSATSGSISNSATLTYVDNSGLPSETPTCATTPKNNCADDGVPLLVDQQGNTANANVLLVKRITAINGDRVKNPNDPIISLSTVVDDPTDLNDTHPNWPSTFLLGVYDAGKVKPGDVVEYTIYFLNAGAANADAVRICDRITGAQQFTGTTIQLQQNGATPTDLTSTADADRATFFASSSSATAGCNFKTTPALDSGAVVVDVTGSTGSPSWSTLVGSTGAGTTNSYGFVRFTTKINP